jgi:hypothetical protein
MKQLMTVVVATVAVTACAAPVQQAPVTPPPQQQAQPAFDPVGSYDFTTDFQGTAVRGALHIRRTEQGLAGTLVTDMTGDLPFTRVAFDGRRGELRAPTEQGDLVMRIEFQDNDRFTGGWELAGGLSGSASGTRRR